MMNIQGDRGDLLTDFRCFIFKEFRYFISDKRRAAFVVDDCRPAFIQATRHSSSVRPKEVFQFRPKPKIRP